MYTLRRLEHEDREHRRAKKKNAADEAARSDKKPTATELAIFAATGRAVDEDSAGALSTRHPLGDPCSNHGIIAASTVVGPAIIEGIPLLLERLLEMLLEPKPTMVGSDCDSSCA